MDVDAFEAAAAAARRECEPAAYRAALELYAGELLPADRYEAWAEEKRGEIRRLRLDLLVELAEACERRGGFVVAVAFAVQQVAAAGDGDGNSAKVPGLRQDPYIERHVEIIARYHGGSLR